MSDQEIDDSNALFCVDWITSYDPQEVIDSLMGTFRDCERYSPAEMRDMAARLCAIGGGLMDAIAREPRRKRKAAVD